MDEKELEHRMTDVEQRCKANSRRLTELSQQVGITIANLSILKNGHAKAVRMVTLDAICRALRCQPGDILVFEESENPEEWVN